MNRAHRTRDRHPCAMLSGAHGSSNRTKRFAWPLSMPRAARCVALCFLVIALCPPVRADDLSDALNAAPPATTPAAVSSPDAPENKPTSDALGTLKVKAPADARIGTLALSNGIKLEGRVWTTLDTPFRVWIVEDKQYHDIDLSLVKQIDVHVLSETMEADWRWLKEGSDQKIYSGKKYPNVDLAYKFTLLNDQVIEGTVVAPVYFEDGAKARTLALYKKYKGNLDETLKDLVYISSITLDLPTPAAAEANQKKTTKLPLLDD